MMNIRRRIGLMLGGCRGLRSISLNITSCRINNVISLIILVIRRAEQYLKNKEVLPQRRQYAQGGENRPQNNYRNNNNQDNRQNNNQDNRQNSNYNNKQVYDKKPKQKFV